MNIQEYISLRTELITRIQLINTQENTALTTSIGFWAANFALYAVTMTAKLSQANIFIASLFQLVLLYIPILLMIPVAKKSGENLYQITSISTYLEIFHEKPSIEKSQNEEGILYWESANKNTSELMDSSKKRSFLFSLNNSYATISFVSALLFALEATYILIIHHEYLLQYRIFTVSFIILLLFLVLAIVLTIRNYRSSSVKINLLDVRERTTQAFVEKAKNIGLMNES